MNQSPLAGNFAQHKQDLKLEVKIGQFSDFCRDLQAALGGSRTMQQVIDHEVARILEKAVRLTDKADRGKIETRVKNRASFKIGDTKWVTNYRGKAQHVPDRVWFLIEAKRQRSLVRKLKKIGLSKQSWYLLAQRAGFKINVPSYVKNAYARFKGDNGANIGVQRYPQNGNYGIAIQNKMPILRFSPPGGYAALFSAIAGRNSFFRRNIKEGVFNDMKKVAAKYPGLLIAVEGQFGGPGPTDESGE